MARVPLEQAIRDPGFTPAVDDVDALVRLLADDELVKYAERAIARAGPAALDALRAQFEQARPPVRARVLRVIGHLAGSASSASSASSPSSPSSGKSSEAHTLLVLALEDPDAKTRRNAAIALGHSRAQGVEEALIRSWDRDERPAMRRSIAATLGKIGSARSIALLREALRAEDVQLARIAERSILLIERTQSRASRGRLDPARAPDRPVDVEAIARRGLEELLSEELTSVAGLTDVRVAGPGRVRARLAAPLLALFSARTMLSFRFPLPAARPRDGEAPSEVIARAATSPAANRVFSTWTAGAARYRIAWTGGGHKRAATWETARAIARRSPELVNDPTASLWELAVAIGHGRVDAALVPRRLDDPRFRWRHRDVPAASHPTIAAALARVAGVSADDVVWDPFVGSGAELIERALAGPCESLLGTDLDARALAAARENIDAARVRAHLQQADALAHSPRGVTLVITNPPMGRRASRVPGLADMLDAFVAHAASLLCPGGRFVWMAPWPARARAAGTRAGLRLDWARVVDMGGFDAEMQRWVKSRRRLPSPRDRANYSVYG
jgi:predicted RNA methylase